MMLPEKRVLNKSGIRNLFIKFLVMEMGSSEDNADKMRLGLFPVIGMHLQFIRPCVGACSNVKGFSIGD